MPCLLLCLVYCMKWTLFKFPSESGQPNQARAEKDQGQGFGNRNRRDPEKLNVPSRCLQLEPITRE